MKKILVIILAVAFLACAPGAALAQGNAQAEKPADMIVVPMLVYISGASCNLNITAGGTAVMNAYIYCFSPVNKIKMNAYLQKEVNGVYQTVENWSETDLGLEGSWSDQYDLQSYGEYRLRVYFYCYYGTTLLESTSRTNYETY